MSYDIPINRRNFLIASGVTGGLLAYAGIKTLVDTGTVSISPTQTIPRDIAPRYIPVPESWIDNIGRVSVEGTPLNKEQIDSLPWWPVNDKGYCKSDAFVKGTKSAVSIPDLYKHLGRDFSINNGRKIGKAKDWVATIPAEPHNTYFSASKENIPKEYQEGKGLETAKRVGMTTNAVFIPKGIEAEQAHKDIIDIESIETYKGNLEPGTYFLGPDGKIITPEDKDINMSLDDLVLTFVMPNKILVKIHYSSLQKIAEKNITEYRGRNMPSINLNALLKKSFNLNPKEHALIFHANKYSASVPPGRQDDLKAGFDNHYRDKYGVSTKLIGGEFLNMLAHIGGFYKVEIVPMKA